MKTRSQIRGIGHSYSKLIMSNSTNGRLVPVFMMKWGKMREARGNTYQAQLNGNYSHFTVKKEKCWIKSVPFPVNSTCWSTTVHLLPKLPRAPSRHRCARAHGRGPHSPCAVCSGKLPGLWKNRSFPEKTFMPQYEKSLLKSNNTLPFQ